MDTQGANKLVMLSKIVLGKTITTIGFPRGPTHIKLFLVHLVADPTAAHVDGLGAGLFAGLVDNGIGCGIVHLDGGGWLWVTKFIKGDAERAGFFRIVEQGSDFCFCCR